MAKLETSMVAREKEAAAIAKKKEAELQKRSLGPKSPENSHGDRWKAGTMNEPMYFLLKRGNFQCHVSFQGSKNHENLRPY